eukprot:10110200-Lingulodinium_polyedra.AAC.1
MARRNRRQLPGCPGPRHRNTHAPCLGIQSRAKRTQTLRPEICLRPVDPPPPTGCGRPPAIGL